LQITSKAATHILKATTHIVKATTHIVIATTHIVKAAKHIVHEVAWACLQAQFLLFQHVTSISVATSDHHEKAVSLAKMFIVQAKKWPVQSSASRDVSVLCFTVFCPAPEFKKEVFC